MDSFINAGKQFLQDQSKDDNKKGKFKNSMRPQYQGNVLIDGLTDSSQDNSTFLCLP